MRQIRAALSYLVMLVASAYQGKGRFDRVIDLSLKAKALNPASRTAFSLLADCYMRIRNYDAAKKILEEALELYPCDSLFNQLTIMAIVDNGEPIENAIPFIREYFKNVPPSQGKTEFPRPLMWLFKITRTDNHARQIADWQTDWTRWAEKVLKEREDKTNPQSDKTH